MLHFDFILVGGISLIAHELENLHSEFFNYYNVCSAASIFIRLLTSATDNCVTLRIAQVVGSCQEREKLVKIGFPLSHSKPEHPEQKSVQAVAEILFTQLYHTRLIML